MILKNVKIIILVCSLIWGSAKPTVAHRLDELLQSSYIMVAPDKISIEIVLSPGIYIASEVFQVIDSDHNGEMSIDEKNSYAAKILGNIALKIDAKEQELILVDVACSPLLDLKEGIGKIRLLVSAKTNEDIAEHQLYFINTFEPMTSVYTINALMPDSKEIQILNQKRDQNQFEIWVGYKQLTQQQYDGQAWLMILGIIVIGAFLTLKSRLRIKGASMV